MIRIPHLILAAALAVPAFAAKPAAKPALKPAQKPVEVAIIHYSQLKEKKLEGTVKNVRLRPLVRTAMVPVIRLTNDEPGQRVIKLRILDLSEPKYDLYIDTNPDGTKRCYAQPPTGGEPNFPESREYFVAMRTKEELEAGIPITLPGTQISPRYLDYFDRVAGRCKEGALRFEGAKKDSSGGGLCWVILDGITRWVANLKSSDDKNRTVSIIVNPGSKPEAMSEKGIILPAADIREMLAQTADSIQDSRNEIAVKVANPVFRYDTLAIMTPIDFSVLPSGPLTPGKKVFVQAFLTNWTDRPASGKVKLNVPNGWKVKELSTAVNMPGYSCKAVAKFVVTVVRAARPGGSLTADADLAVQGVEVRLHAEPGKQ